MSCEHEGIIINPPAPTPSGGGNLIVRWQDVDGQPQQITNYTSQDIYEAVQNGIVPVFIQQWGSDTIHYFPYYLFQCEPDGAYFCRPGSFEPSYGIDMEGEIFEDS